MLLDWWGPSIIYAGENDVASYLAMLESPRAGQDMRRLTGDSFGRPLPDGVPVGAYLFPAGGNRHGPKSFTYELLGRVTQRALS